MLDMGIGCRGRGKEGFVAYAVMVIFLGGGFSLLRFLSMCKS